MIDLQELGITKEELAERVVERIAEVAMSDWLIREDGNGQPEPSQKFECAIEAKVTAKVHESIEAIAARHVLPNVESYVENLCLQETNKWGEAKGTKMTFREYLVSQTEAYMTEMVDYEGKPKGRDSYSWTGKQTRITHLVHKHLHYEIEQAMRAALGNVTSNIAKGLEETVRLKLAEAKAAMKVEVKTGR